MESLSPLSAIHGGCESIIREQIEILWRYQQRDTPLDPVFLENHARMIVQIVGYMKGPDQHGEPPEWPTPAQEQP